MKKLSLTALTTLEKKCIEAGFLVITSKVLKPTDPKQKYYCAVRHEAGGKPVAVGYGRSIPTAKALALAEALETLK